MNPQMLSEVGWFGKAFTTTFVMAFVWFQNIIISNIGNMIICSTISIDSSSGRRNVGDHRRKTRVALSFIQYTICNFIICTTQHWWQDWLGNRERFTANNCRMQFLGCLKFNIEFSFRSVRTAVQNWPCGFVQFYNTVTTRIGEWVWNEIAFPNWRTLPEKDALPDFLCGSYKKGPYIKLCFYNHYFANV